MTDAQARIEHPVPARRNASVAANVLRDGSRLEIRLLLPPIGRCLSRITVLLASPREFLPALGPQGGLQASHLLPALGFSDRLALIQAWQI